MVTALLSGQGRPNTAYLFPGQGSQLPGMGLELYEHSPAARQVFDTCDDALGFPLSPLMFHGPPEELERTVNSQPAILTMSLACLKALQQEWGEERLPRPVLLAGHSLGEYTALAASGVLELEDAIRLVRERGRLMQDASDRLPTGMAAILGLEEVRVEEICRATGTYISNINAPNHIVISGERIPLARALDLAAMRGARKSVPLRVSGAFHSEFMRPAVEGMLRTLEKASLHEPAIPVVANCTGKPLRTTAEVREELAHQLCTCVQWKRSVDFMVERGVTNFVEVGPGRTLSGLVRRINPAVRVTPVNNLTSIRSLVT